jgi:2-C-methyl-D-erythritol 4-phosphate cytidylyltransferase
LRGSQKKVRIVAVVPAAGVGQRFGPGTSKQLLSLGGKPLVVRPLEVLQSVPEIVEIIPVLRVQDMELVRQMFEEYGLSKIKKIAVGGKERQDSVYHGLKLAGKADFVLIHDGVRPLIDRGLIERAIEALIAGSAPFADGGGESILSGLDGVVVGVPVKDTIKEAEDGTVKRTLKRSALWAIQTPQLFPYRRLLSVYEKAMQEGFYSTDDSALVEHYGGKIGVVMGSYSNLKVTTPEDLYMAEFLLRDAK